MIYLLIFFICIFFSLLEQTDGVGQLASYLRLPFLIFFIVFIGLRYQVGPDYFSYEIIYFDREKYLDMEFLFRFFISIFNRWGISYNYFLLFIAALSIFCKAITLSKYSPYFFLSVVIAFISCFLSDMGQIRFSLSIAILWLSIPFCIERKFVWFLIVVVCAFLIHQSSIIFLFIYWFYKVRMNLGVMLAIWGGCYLLSFSLSSLGIFDLFSGFVEDENISGKIDIYADNELYGERYGISFFGLFSKILVLLLIYYSSIKNQELKQLYTNIYFWGGCFFFLFSFNEIFGTRLSIYFLSFEALIVPTAIYYIKDIKLHYVLMSVFIAKALYQLVVQVYIKYPEMYLPYRNMLF